MAYTKQTWHDSPATDTPLSAARLGHIEDGIEAAALVADQATGNLAALTPADIGAAAATDVYAKTAADARFAHKAGDSFTGPVSITGLLTASGGIEGPVAIRLVTSSVTLLSTDQIILVDATAGNIIITIPTASSGSFAWNIWRIDNSSNTVTLVRSGTDTGTGPNVLTSAGTSISVASDGTSRVHFISSGSVGAMTEIRTVTANATLQDSDEILQVDTTSGNITITIPAASGSERGWNVINIGSGVVNLAKTGTDTYIGPTSIASGTMAVVLADGVSKIRVFESSAAAATTVAWTDIQGKPSTFTPSPHASTHATGGTDPISPANIGAAPTVHTHTDADVADPVPFVLNNLGTAKTITWTAAHRLQSGVLDQAACTITLAGIPDGGYLHLRFATGVSNCAITWAQSISGVTGIIFMNNGNAPSMPTTALQYASVLVERLADKLYIHQTGKSTA